MTDEDNKIAMPEGVPDGPWSLFHISLQAGVDTPDGGYVLQQRFFHGNSEIVPVSMSRSIAALPEVCEAAMMALDILTMGMPKTGAEAQGMGEMRQAAIESLIKSLRAAGFKLQHMGVGK